MRDHPTRRVERLLTLRQFPGLADAELAELAVIAENVVERFYPAGARVAGPARPAAIQMVVAGRLAAVDGSRTWVPHHAVGAVEVIAGRASVAPMTAEVDTRTLEIAADDFRELLADNFTVMSTAWRLLAARLLAAGREGLCDELSRRAARRLLVDATSEPLDLVTGSSSCAAACRSPAATSRRWRRSPSPRTRSACPRARTCSAPARPPTPSP